MLFLLASILIAVWAIMLALKVTVGAIHLLLVAGLVLFAIGFFKGRTTAPPTRPVV